ncbi:MAG: dipeptidase PepE [Lutibacter sp.]|uniref:dipeptidase PepE n=1 Tax=Lutibacter sp. TaxID=1925666 RepID=UPI001827B198|nr:dipeptidase PepE [Lutibacter sp.]MBT8316151.1 dipeptidase PepE [Lutibacter sp.]NNJ57011.1 dipeptidase PepE [Lutibacter sp.]
MKKLLIASTSTVHGKAYLEYILPELSNFFKGVNEVLFIPYARPSGLSHEEYTNRARVGFDKINIKLKGIHEFNNTVDAVNNAKSIFTGGGNTFLLLKQLYDNKLISAIKNVVENGTPYFGTSAGSNITGVTIQNTNDMPIIYPPSFTSLGLINFNLNPHYLDPDIKSKHMGETRETRINEFHTINKIPVLGLREGSWLSVVGNKVVLKGSLDARLFQQNKPAIELPPETDFSFLM